MKELRKMKKFRFQLLHEWLINNYKPCKVADIGGGKGLLTYLLNLDSFKSVVIDPYNQTLPKKYKDLRKQKIKISTELSIPRINENFKKITAKKFDLLIGLHAHGSNMKIIEATAKYKKSFVLMPCCVIDEPVIPKQDINWFDSLEKYANELGIKTERFALHFKGQNKSFYSK